MRQRIRNRQQQAVGRRQGCSQTASGDESRDDVRQAGNFGRGQHDDVAVERDFSELHNAVTIDVGDAHERIALVDVAPVRDPFRQTGEVAAHERRVDIEFYKHCERRHGDIEQHHEKQRPEYRHTGFVHGRRRVVTYQHMRQRRRAHHQAKHERDEIVAALVLRLCAFAGKWLRVRYHRSGARQVGSLGLGPFLARLFDTLRIVGQRPRCDLDLEQRGVTEL